MGLGLDRPVAAFGNGVLSLLESCKKIPALCSIASSSLQDGGLEPGVLFAAGGGLGSHWLMTGSAFKRCTLCWHLLLGKKSKGEEVRRRGGSGSGRVGGLADSPRSDLDRAGSLQITF